MSLEIILLVALVLAAVGTVMAPRLLWAVIGLAVTSAILTMLMFRFGAPIAGVFELSVCAGLIPAIFISAISLTRRLTPEDAAERARQKRRRFAVLLSQVTVSLDFVRPLPAKGTDVRDVLWNMRHIDLLGQIVSLLAGAFGVVILIKEYRRDR